MAIIRYDPFLFFHWFHFVGKGGGEMFGDSQALKPIILIVDDDQMVLRAVYRRVQICLRRSNAESWVDVWTADNRVEIAEYADNFLRMFGSRGRYLLLTDGDMPYGSGDAVVQELRKLLGPRLTDAAIVSGNEDRFLPVCKRLQIPFIAKPEMNGIEALVERFLDACV